jgi:hypothetical protein
MKRSINGQANRSGEKPGQNYWHRLIGRLRTQENMAGQTHWPGVKSNYRHCPISVPVVDIFKAVILLKANPRFSLRWPGYLVAVTGPSPRLLCPVPQTKSRPNLKPGQLGVRTENPVSRFHRKQRTNKAGSGE